MTSSIYVIIVNWNGKDDTITCLQSLHRDEYTNKKIIVVDNGSGDGSVSAIRSHFPHITILENTKNTGFTGGNNTGIRFALDNGADYVFLLNNDTTVERDTILKLAEVYEHDRKYGIAVPAIFSMDDPEKPLFVGSKVDFYRGTAIHDNSRETKREAVPFDIPWATGCAMFMSAEIMKAAGGFDDRYFLNWEDVDLSFRVRNLGYSIAIVPAARVYHKAGESLKLLDHSLVFFYYNVRNRLLFNVTHNKSFYRHALCYIASECVSTWLRLLMKGQIRAMYRAVVFTIYAFHDHISQRYGPYRGK